VFKWISPCLLMVVMALPVQAETLRDPTEPPQPSRAPQPAQPQLDLSLDSILISDNRRIAVINGQSASTGDSVGDAQVRRIEADRVLVEHNGTTRTLRLERAQSVRQSP